MMAPMVNQRPFSYPQKVLVESAGFIAGLSLWKDTCPLVPMLAVAMPGWMAPFPMLCITWSPPPATTAVLAVSPVSREAWAQTVPAASAVLQHRGKISRGTPTASRISLDQHPFAISKANVAEASE